MFTAGLDLSTQAAKTAVAVLDWRGATARLVELRTGSDDDAVVDLAGRVDRLGIDCPLGWPDDFVAFLQAHASGAVDLADESGEDLRRRLAWRSTDVRVRAAGARPLTVAAERLGYTAMRAARILALLASRGTPVDRAGSGRVVEVYPAASLQRWGLTSRGYKGAQRTGALGDLVADLLVRAPWLDLGPHRAALEGSDDLFDAVVAALTARAAALGRCLLPAPEEVGRARREGWIMVPDTAGSLSALVGPAA